MAEQQIERTETFDQQAIVFALSRLLGHAVHAELLPDHRQPTAQTDNRISCDISGLHIHALSNPEPQRARKTFERGVLVAFAHQLLTEVLKWARLPVNGGYSRRE